MSDARKLTAAANKWLRGEHVDKEVMVAARVLPAMVVQHSEGVADSGTVLQQWRSARTEVAMIGEGTNLVLGKALPN